MPQILAEVQLHLHRERSNHLNLVVIKEIHERPSIQRSIMADIYLPLKSLEEGVDLRVLIGHNVLDCQPPIGPAAPQHLLKNLGVILHVVKRGPALDDRERTVGAGNALDIVTLKIDIVQASVAGLFPGNVDHPLRDIDSVNASNPLSAENGELASPAGYIQQLVPFI